VHVDRFHYFAVDPYPRTFQTNRGEVVISAASGAARPSDAQRGFQVFELFCQCPAHWESSCFGVDQCEVTKIDACASHEPAKQLWRIVAELFEQWLFGQRPELP